MAKHIACGSLPFSDSGVWIRSVYITDNVLKAIKNGLNIQDVHEFGGSSLEYLRRLPCEKQVDAFYGINWSRVVDIKDAQKRLANRYFTKHGKPFSA